MKGGFLIEEVIDTYCRVCGVIIRATADDPRPLCDTHSAEAARARLFDEIMSGEWDGIELVDEPPEA